MAVTSADLETATSNPLRANTISVQVAATSADLETATSYPLRANTIPNKILHTRIQLALT